MADETDEQLVRRTRDTGDTRAFGQLVTRYQGHVYGLAYSLLGNWAEAQDKAQETFVRAYVNLGTLKEPAKFAAWLRRVAFSTCMDWLRTFRPHAVKSLDAMDVDQLDAMPADVSAPPLEVEKLELAEMVLAAVKQLPAKYRIPLMMFHLDGLSYEKVADFLEVPLGTAKSLISRAKAMLKPALEAAVGDVFNEQKLAADFGQRVAALIDAVKIGDVQRVAALLDIDPRLADARTAENNAPLHVAAIAGHQPIVEMLLKRGAPLDSAGSHLTATPLNFAAQYGHVDLVQMLIRAGADPTGAAHYAFYGKPARHDAIIELVRKHLRDNDPAFRALESEYAETFAQTESGRISKLIVKQYPATTYLLLSSGTPVDGKQIAPHQDRFMKRVDELRRSIALVPRGPITFIYHPVEGNLGRWVFENGFPVADDLELNDRELFIERIGPLRVASLLFTGSYRHFGEPWGAVHKQLDIQGLRGDWTMFRERYHYMESFDSPENRTELQVPLL